MIITARDEEIVEQNAAWSLISRRQKLKVQRHSQSMAAASNYIRRGSPRRARPRRRHHIFARGVIEWLGESPRVPQRTHREIFRCMRFVHVCVKKCERWEHCVCLQNYTSTSCAFFYSKTRRNYLFVLSRQGAGWQSYKDCKLRANLSMAAKRVILLDLDKRFDALICWENSTIRD